MCDPTTVLIGATGLSVLGGIGSARAQRQQGAEAQRAAEFNANELEAQGGVARDNAQAEATRIRRAARMVRGEARAGYGAMGVDVNSGSAQDVDEEIGRSSEVDAYMAILSGDRFAAGNRRQAAELRRGGAAAAAVGKANANATLLGTAANAGMSWARFGSTPGGWRGTANAGFFYGNRGSGD